MVEGEDPGTRRTDDARRLVRLYSELLEFKGEQLRRAQRILPTLSSEARQEILATDVLGLEADLRQTRDRLWFWSRQLWGLMGISVDRQRREVHHAGGRLPLTDREFELLAFLMEHPDNALAARRLAQEAWGKALSGEELRIYVARLRRKLRAGRVPMRLECRRSWYRVVPE
jgi:DNA-binding response OmpR family regulator